MRKSRWNLYAKYLIIADNSNGKLSPNYGVFTEFKRVVKALERMVGTHSDAVFDFENTRYKKLINNAEAEQTLREINEANYNKNIELIANQLGIILRG